VSKKKRRILSDQHLSDRPTQQATTSETLAKFAITAQRFSGPLPPPAMLRQYEELLPGSASRIISMAERQSAHRQGIENKVISSNILNERLGMVLGFVICVLAILAGAYALMKGRSGFGIASIVGGLGAPLAAFIYGKSEQRKDLEARRQAIVDAASHTRPD